MNNSNFNDKMISKQAAREVLEHHILRFWQTRMVDNERGGFYGRIDGHNTLHPDAPKGAVLNARILWSFAAAARVLHNTPYRILAARAYDYLMQRFIDREHGGVYWSLHADGTPLDTKKQTYAIAFAIYGLAEYYRATQNSEALNAAIHLFDDIETHAFQSYMVNDQMVNGYVEALTRDWQPIADMRLSEQDENGAFTMNTHLHVLEAYTNLYRALADVQRDDVQSTKAKVAKQLRTLIDIFTKQIFNPETEHLDLFFNTDWQSKRDKNSPGHEIEAAWLLHEALEVLGDPVLLQETLPVCQQLAQAAEDGIFNESQWWCYAEAVVGYIDQWKLNQKDLPVEAAINLEMAEAAWDYIQSHLIDREHGEFYWAILPDGTPDTSNDKAGFWKCPYHNSRMCIEIIERL
jgi:mannobiose 2-epimerase